MDTSWAENFTWTAPTLFCLFVGLIVGGLLGHYMAKDEEKKKAVRQKPGPAFCPHCGKALGG